MNTLGIFINDQLAFEYDLTIPLNAQQLEFIDKMDSDMQRGIKMYGQLISKPDVRERATFVALNLLKALQRQEEAKVAVSCAYLSKRLPHVVQVHARDQGHRVEIDFVEEH